MPTGVSTSIVAVDGVSIVIVSYRCEAMLRDCLESIRSHPPRRPLDVHVVDNASGDGTAEMVEREFPEVTLTRNAENVGFGAANNQALRTARSDYLLVLNPDTRLTDGALETLCRLLDERPRIGMAGPRLERPDGSFDHAAKRSFPTPLGALGHFTGLGRRAAAGEALSQYRATGLGEHEPGSVDAVNGAFMMIRRTALERVGLFDERYWMYMEDLDLCFRFHQAGWEVWYEPAATVLHVKAGTSGEHRNLRLTYAFHYGMYRFYKDHYATHRNPLANGFIYAGIAVKFSASAMASALARARIRAGRSERR